MVHVFYWLILSIMGSVVNFDDIIGHGSHRGKEKVIGSIPAATTVHVACSGYVEIACTLTLAPCSFKNFTY